MDFVQIPVFGQSVKPGLGLRFRGNYWAFFERRTELSPWLALHRESINDTELDELMLHGFPRTRTGETVDCKVLSHFGLTQGDLYADGFFVGRTERQRTAAFTGDLVVIKIPASVNPQKDLLNPGSIYWASESKLLEHSAGTPEYERGKALVEMATILLARWREHDAQNLEFKVKNRIAELWEEGKAIGSGVGTAAMGFIEGLWNLIKVSVEFTANALKATSKGFEILINSNFAQIQQMLAGAGMAAYNTAQEMIAAVNEGLRILNRIGSDQLLRAGLFEFLDGYSESVPHLRRLRNASTVVVAIGIEVVLALATFGGSLAVGVARAGAKLARGASKVGPFTVDALRHLARYANALDKAQAQKMPALESAPKAPSNAKAAGNAGGSKGGSADPTAKTQGNTSQGANSPKVADTKTAGEPISMINGEELLQLLDCSMPGLVGLNWQRTYRSSLAGQGFNAGLGAGWAHPLSQHIEVQSGALNFVDEEGRTVYFKPLKVGQRCANTSEFLTVVRTGENAYQLQNSNGLGLVWHFENIDGGASLNCALVRIEDAFGNALRVEYTQGLPTQLHTSQTTWVLAYNEQGLLLQIAQLAQGDTAHTGMNQLVLVKYRYNPKGQLVAATDAAGFEEHYAYNPRNVLVQRTLKSGYNIYFEWEQVGEHSRCVRQWGDPVDGQPTYQYRFEWDIHGTGGLAAVNASIDSRGARTEYQFNAQGLPVFEKGPEGAVTRTTYNSNGQVLERVDALGHREQFQYNSVGHLVGYINKLGQAHRFELNRQGQVLKHTDAAGHVRTNTYTPEGLLASHTDATGATTRYRYNHLGLLCEITNPLGQSTRMLYNAQGQVQAQTNALGQSNTYHFDTWGRLASVTNPLGRSAYYAYDLLGRCTRATNHEGLSTAYSYSPLGQLESITDPTGRSTVYEYADKLSQPTARIDAQGFTLRYRYDSERNLVELQNENGQSCHFEYDLAERLVKESGFDGRVQTYQYNLAGHLLEKQEWGVSNDQPLAYTRYTRDALGRLLKAEQRDGEGVRQHRLRLGKGLDKSLLVAHLAAHGLHSGVHGGNHVISLGCVDGRIAAAVLLAESRHKGLVGRVVHVMRPVCGVEQAQHRFAHRTDDVFVGRKTAGDQRDVLGQACAHKLLDEVDAHGTWQKEIHRIRLGRAQLGKLGGVVDLPDLGVDLVGHLALVLALEAGDAVLARRVVGRHHHHAAKFLIGSKLPSCLVELVILVGRAEEIRVALGACELAGTGVVREVRHLGREQRRRHRQRHVRRDGAGEQVDLLALHKAVHQLLGLVGAAGHVGLHKLDRLAAQLAPELLDRQGKAVTRLGTGACKWARDIKRHADLDGAGLRNRRYAAAGRQGHQSRQACHNVHARG